MSSPYLLRADAVVLRRHDLGEADRIVTVFTAQHGKVRAVAKGVRRPTSKLGGHLELFIHSQIVLARGRNLDVITQAETVSSFLGLREDLWRASHAYYVAELLDRMTEDRAENLPLFRLLLATLDRVSSARRPDQAVRFFEMQVLGLLGYRPELRHCVQCRRDLDPERVAFSSADGGVVCPECRPRCPGAKDISANAVKILRLYQTADWETTSRLRIGDDLTGTLEQCLREYLHYVVETQLKSAAFVASLREQGIGGSPS